MRTQRPSRPPTIPDSLDADPADPVQRLDAFHEEDLDVDAMSATEAGAELDLARAETFYEEAARELDPPPEPTLETIEQEAHDVGDLYGIHTPPAVDRVHAEDREAFEEGQTWLEALGTSAAEHGAVPERGLDAIVDDEDVNDPPHPTDTRDTPVADRGSGGPAGV